MCFQQRAFLPKIILGKKTYSISRRSGLGITTIERLTLRGLFQLVFSILGGWTMQIVGGGAHSLLHFLKGHEITFAQGMLLTALVFLLSMSCLEE